MLNRLPKTLFSLPAVGHARYILNVGLTKVGKLSKLSTFLFPAGADRLVAGCCILSRAQHGAI